MDNSRSMVEMHSGICEDIAGNSTNISPNPEAVGSSPAFATILSDQNRYTHLKPLRNQGFQRFYALFFQSVFYRYTRAFKSVRKDLNSILG